MIIFLQKSLLAVKSSATDGVFVDADAAVRSVGRQMSVDYKQGENKGQGRGACLRIKN